MECEILFHEESAKLPTFYDESKTVDWLINIAKEYGKSIHFINYILCDDEGLLHINRTYLDHDYYTDIITFPYREDEVIESDIYLSVDRIKENAQDEGVSFESEWLRVLAHGLLHLCGLRDKSDEDSSTMRTAENLAMAKY